MNKGQILWNNSVRNKLFEIKPVIGQSQPVVRNDRQQEVVLARLCIGYKRITHTATNPSPSLPIPVGLNFLFLNFDSKI